jgi:hypothetical protein
MPFVDRLYPCRLDCLDYRRIGGAEGLRLERVWVNVGAINMENPPDSDRMVRMVHSTCVVPQSSGAHMESTGMESVR